MAIKPKKSAPKEEPNTVPPRGSSGLMNNPRVLALIGRVLGNPTIVQDMAQGIVMATGSSAVVMELLGNQRLLDSLSDQGNLQEYIRENPDVAAMMEQVIRQFLGSGTEGDAGQDEEQLVDMLESHLEEEMEQAEREGEEQRTHAQEQMFEHSQALQAHNQQQQLGHASTSAGPSVETSYNPTTSQQYGSVSRVSRQNSGTGITQDQLASALANALGSSSSSPLTNVSPMASINQSSSPSERPSFPPAPPPSYSSSLQPFNSTPRSNSSGGGGEARHGPISAASLQQALANVRPPGSPASGAVNGHPAARYQLQLEQLQLMGITDETACLHALAATGGDLQAALDILYSL